MNPVTRLLTLALVALPLSAQAQTTTTTATEPAKPAAPEVAPAPEAATAPEAAPAQSAEEAAMLAELMASGAAADPAADSGPSLRFYGFADFTGGGYLSTKGTAWESIASQYMSFAVGNLNLFADAHIADRWSSLSEIRFMFIPHGSGTGISNAVLDPVNRTGWTDTGAADYTNFDRNIQWGGIHIERAYLQYTPFSFLTVRAGRFLTPYGVWNVDHGSPVIIGTYRPYIIGEQFFPEAQTGVELLGSVGLGDGTLGYHLTVSNGRGPIEVYRDLDGNKALGGRLYYSTYALGQLTVGASAYGGTYTDRRRQLDLSSGSPTIVSFDFEKYDEVSLSGDVKWQYKGVVLQSEISVHDRVWDDNARPASKAYGAQPGQTQPDVRRFGIYVIAGYRLPWLGLMPFMLYEHYDTGMTGGLFTARYVDGVSGGLNLSPVPGVVLKAQFLHAMFSSGSTVIKSPEALQRFELQAAWAF